MDRKQDNTTETTKPHIIERYNTDTLHCPLCGKTAHKIKYSYYCKSCDVDFDENKRLII